MSEQQIDRIIDAMDTITKRGAYILVPLFVGWVIFKMF